MTQRMLIIAPSWIGDMVMAQPLLAQLKQFNTYIDVLALPWIAPLLGRMDEVSDIIPMPIGHGRLALRDRYRLGHSLKGRYQQAFVLPNTLKSALIPWFANIPIRTGYRGEMRYGLLNDLHVLDQNTHPLLVQRYLALAPGTTSAPVVYPRLTVTDEWVTSTMKSLSLQPQQPAIGLCPGAEYGPAKRWPAESYGQLARHLLDQGFAVWLFGSAKDQPVTQEIQRYTDNACLDLAGKTSLDQAIDLMSLTQTVVTNDSGLMHVAAALDRPVVAIFGSTSPAYTPPLSDCAQIVQHKLSCSPCFSRECPLGHTQCLNDISVAEVLTVVNSMGANSQS